jgi:hypothetical protein
MSAVPILVSGPSSEPVTVEEVKLHARIDGADDDALIAGLISAAVAYLDAWGGVLGRAIMEQEWKVYFPCAGEHLLPFPDVIAAAVVYDDASTAALDAEVMAGGWRVNLDQPGWVTFSAELPENRLPLCRTLIFMIVAYWYGNREGAGEEDLSGAPLAVNAIISSLRWRRL